MTEEHTRQEPATQDGARARNGQQPSVAELTEDLRRLGAEYANYRKRAERDRQAAAEQAYARLVTRLLPAVDVVEAARAHGELTGPLRAVAVTLSAVLAEAGAEPVGQPGDRFDPNVHEAVAHHHSQALEVVAPTVTDVHRPGYQIGGQVLRPALVEVTEPDPEDLEPVPGDDDPDVVSADAATWPARGQVAARDDAEQ